ncbi:serine-rich adhesin for platelets-like [Ptychodera flava]|uniref:serine-rich adhesin for platelets-like n=1 Tax=Ptychodera flava TaxID=63121 RepID=UPI00396A8174
MHVHLLYVIFWQACFLKELSGLCLPGHHSYIDSCYEFIVNNAQTWEDARDTCQQQGGYLIQVNDQSEHDFLLQAIATDNHESNFWVGAHGQNNYWIDDTQPVYTKWYGGSEPYRPYGCVFTPSFISQWKIGSCTGSYKYICERDGGSGCLNNEHEFNGKCYKQGSTSEDWESAKMKCQNLGGNLLIIDSEDEQNYFAGGKSAIPKYWLGMNDRGFKWTDGSYTVYASWNEGSNEPNGDGPCVEMSVNMGYNWNDCGCTHIQNFICEYDSFETTTMSTTTTQTTRPTTSRSTTSEPTTSQSTTSEPTTSQSTTSEPTTSQSTTSEPTTSQSTTSEPTTSQSTTSEPTTSQSSTSEPTTSQSTTSEPTTSQSTTIEPTTSQSTTSEPTTSQSTTSEPTTSQSTTSEPTTSQSTTIEPTTSQSTTIEPTTSQSTTNQPTTSRSTTTQSTTSLPTTSQSTASTTDASSSSTKVLYNTFVLIEDKFTLMTDSFPIFNTAIDENTPIECAMLCATMEQCGSFAFLPQLTISVCELYDGMSSGSGLLNMPGTLFFQRLDAV